MEGEDAVASRGALLILVVQFQLGWVTIPPVSPPTPPPAGEVPPPPPPHPLMPNPIAAQRSKALNIVFIVCFELVRGSARSRAARHSIIVHLLITNFNSIAKFSIRKLFLAALR
jgi:hypothetical protein